MKKRGFTLIELIVVIAIIGVLAAILVPTLNGYVRKSKIASANSAAKSIYTGAQTAITEMTGMYDYSISDITTPFVMSCTVPSATATDADGKFEYLVYTAFSDVTKLDSCTIILDEFGTSAVGLCDKNGYPGSNPKQMTVDEYETYQNDASAAAAYAYS